MSGFLLFFYSSPRLLEIVLRLEGNSAGHGGKVFCACVPTAPSASVGLPGVCGEEVGITR